MKKTYIIPAAKFINLATEDSVALLTLSQQDDDAGEGVVPGGLSNERTPSSFIWGDED